jgi:hypothetical protein
VGAGALGGKTWHSGILDAAAGLGCAIMYLYDPENMIEFISGFVIQDP